MVDVDAADSVIATPLVALTPSVPLVAVPLTENGTVTVEAAAADNCTATLKVGLLAPVPSVPLLLAAWNDTVGGGGPESSSAIEIVSCVCEPSVAPVGEPSVRI